MTARRRRRVLVHAVWAAVTLAACALTWWAMSTVLAPPAAIPTAADAPVYVVAEGEVGVASQVQANVRFATERTAVSGAGGILTSISLPATGELTAGAVLVAVNLRPVVALAGTTPMFRDLASGTRGPDVAQLRAALGVGEGDLFDRRTVAAVKAWQKSLGVEQDGVVRRGDVLFLPALPAKGFVAADLAVGSPVQEGDELLSIVGAPVVEVPADAGGRLAAGMTAHLTLPDGTAISGALTGPFREADGLAYFRVVTADGVSPCEAACAAQFPITTTSQISGTVEVVPVATGLVVPDASLITLPSGGLAVRRENGELQDIQVVSRGSGVSVVEGLELGEVIQLFGETQ